VIWRSAAGVRSAVTIRGVLLFAGENHRMLEDGEAALWDLLSRGYSLDAATRLLAAVAGITLPEAERLAEQSVAEWEEAKLIEVADG
jgi:hypothetical protein